MQLWFLASPCPLLRGTEKGGSTFWGLSEPLIAPLQSCGEGCPLQVTWRWLLFSRCLQLFTTPWTAACQVSLSFTFSQSLLKLNVYWIGDAIQPSHPLSPLSPPDLSFFQHQALFQWGGSLHQVAKVLELQLQHQFFQWIFRVGFSPSGLAFNS